MGLFSRKQDEPENAAAGGADGAFEVVDAARAVRQAEAESTHTGKGVFRSGHPTDIQHH